MILGFNRRSRKQNVPSVRLDISALGANFLCVLIAPMFSQLPWKQDRRVVVLNFLKFSSSPASLSRTIH